MIKIVLLLLFPFFLFSKNVLLVSFPFETYFIKQISNDLIDLTQISNTYTPIEKELSNASLKRLSKSKIYFHFGLDSEKNYAKLLSEINPNLKIVNMSSGIKKIKNDDKENLYVWTDPLLVRDIAKNIYEEIILIDPINKNTYHNNYNRFLNKLDNEFLKIKRKLYSTELSGIFVYDENWDYLAKRFRLDLYKKEKRYIKANEINELASYTVKNNIKKVLIDKNDKNDLVYTLSNNTNTQIIRHDIFDKTWDKNLNNFFDSITKTSNK